MPKRPALDPDILRGHQDPQSQALLARGVAWSAAAMRGHGPHVVGPRSEGRRRSWGGISRTPSFPFLLRRRTLYSWEARDGGGHARGTSSQRRARPPAFVQTTPKRGSTGFFLQPRLRWLLTTSHVRPQCADDVFNLHIKSRPICLPFSEVGRQPPSNLRSITTFPIVAKDVTIEV